MHAPDPEPFLSAEVPLGTNAFEQDLAFFQGLGFRLESIYPADAPSRALLSGLGLRLRLERGASPGAGRIRILSAQANSVDELRAPGGTRLEVARESFETRLPALHVPFSLQRATESDSWSLGRAGMQYRDLLPERAGGHFIVSQIRIPEGGEVPDYVHFHRIDLQWIYCLKGWAQLVYEDQGEAFRLEAGDLVLQPPEIRHRVLECSDGLEVLELGSPALHETLAEHGIELPNDRLDPERLFEGQRFLRHRGSQAQGHPSAVPGLVAFDTGLLDASGGAGRLELLRPDASCNFGSAENTAAFRFWFVKSGALRVRVQGEAHELLAQDFMTLPMGAPFEVLEAQADLELLDFASGARA